MAEIIETIDRQKAQHYSWGNNCDGWHLVQSDALSIIEEKCRPALQRFATTIRKQISFSTC
jgi:hypothetical protein